MPDPIQVELNFQELIGFFDSSPSIRNRHKLFFDFADRLDGKFRKYESYILQLLDDLPLYTDCLSWSGIDPAEIEENLEMMERIHSKTDLLKKSNYFSHVKKNLQEVCVLLYGCVGNVDKAGEYLREITGLSGLEPGVAEESADESKQIICQLYEQLSTELQKNQKRPADQKESLQRLHQHLTALLEDDDSNVLIPVAEQYGADRFKSREFGRLRKMTVELYGDAESKSSDELIWTTNIYGAEVSSVGQTASAVNASRKLLNETSQYRATKGYYRGAIRFKNTAAIHDGHSADVAIAALWYTILLKKAGQRERYLIHSNSAITGDIDTFGEVKPVDGKSIELKVRAVFFSWAKILVVPASQREFFESETQKLQELYPNRILPIVGVNYLRDLFYDRRVAVHHIQGRIPYLLNRIKVEYSKYILVPTIIILLFVVARLVYGPVDRNAVDIEYEGSHLLLKNKTGSVLDRIEVGETTVNYQNTGRRAVQYPLAALADLSEDGTNELIFINRVEQSNLEASTLKAWSVTGDSLIWERKITFNYHYHRQSAFVNLGLRASELQLMNTNDGPKIVLNAGLIQYFQSVAFTIDAVSGEIEQEYVHPGRLNDIMVYDIDDDEIDELIFTGINNAYWNAMVGVLEYGEAQGYGPATRDYIPAGLNPANEEVYLLIPKSVIGKHFNPVWKYNMGQRIHYDLLSENFYFTVVEGTKRFTEFEDELEVIFYFSRDMKPVGIGTNDLYDITARNLYQQGEIMLEPDFDYFESLQDSILYRHGEQFLRTEEYFKTTNLH